MSDDISLDVIKLTQETLGKFVKRPPLTEKLLRKPPFKFLHDIVTSVIRDTGFLKGVFTSEEMKHENIKDRDGKVAFLQKLIDAVKTITGEKLTARPSKIVAGHEPAKTNELLQAIGKALQNNLSSVEYVETVSKSKKSKPDSVQQNSGAKAKVSTEKRPVQKTKASQEKQKSRVPAVEKKPTSKKKSDTPVVSKEEHHEEKLLQSKDTINEPTLPINTFETNDGGLEIQANGIENEVTDSVKHGIIAASALEKEVELNSVENVHISDSSSQLETKVNSVNGESVSNFESSHQSFEGELVSKKELASTSVEKKPESEQKRPLSAVRSSKRSAIRRVSNSNDNSATEPAAVSLITETDTKQIQQSIESSRSDIKESEVVKSVSPQQPHVPRPASVRRSARPSSARPAAPRIRDRGEVVLTEEIPQVTGKVNVIFENNNFKEQDEDENFVVLEAETPQVVEEPSPSPSDTSKLVEEGQHGHLVSQILETQKELEDDNLIGAQNSQSKKVEIEWEGGRQKEREVALKDVDRLRSSIQTLTRAANPLGKLMDYLHEDVESMQRELKMWQNANKDVAAQLRREQHLTMQTTEPLKQKLQELEETIAQQLDQISTLKSTILRNDEKINSLVQGNAFV